MNIYLNTFEPLCGSKQGALAVEQFVLPGYIDGSCRREPDLEGDFPAISALCRGGIFVPKLVAGDIIVYLTKKGRYEGLPLHWRLVSAVQVKECFSSHEEAATWYRSRGLRLPYNCIVEGNPPVAWEKTHQRPVLPDGEEKTLANWDQKYEQRAARHPEFCACEAIYRELHHPPVLLESDLIAAFKDYGRIPVTQNPPRITQEDYQRLLIAAGIKNENSV